MLGRHRHAFDLLDQLEERIAKLPANLARDRGHLTAKLAVAVAQQTGSARIHRELRTLDAGLQERWPDDSHARAFHEALVSA